MSFKNIIYEGVGHSATMSLSNFDLISHPKYSKKFFKSKKSYSATMFHTKVYVFRNVVKEVSIHTKIIHQHHVVAFKSETKISIFSKSQGLANPK